MFYNLPLLASGKEGTLVNARLSGSQSSGSATMQWIILTAVLLGATCAWGCDLRYFQHYEHKGCRAAVTADDGCPKSFLCDDHSDHLHQKCLHNGKWYSEGEDIVQECDHCSCQGDPFGGAFIECAAVDCPDWDTQNESCYMGYRPEDCCPREMCPKESKDQRKKCRQGDQEVDVGRFVQTGDPCQRCLCTEKGVQCSKVNCLTSIYAQKIRRGCLPLYNEPSCCLTGMYCDEVKGAKPIAKPETTDDKCHYQGQYYELGSTVRPTANECFECTCSVPPDFTCLRGRC